MKIGMIIPQLRIGGAAYQLLQLAQQLRKNGHEIFVYTVYNEMKELDHELMQGITFRSIGESRDHEKKVYRQPVGLLIYLLFLFRITLKLFKLLERDNLDITNPHEWPMHWSAALLKIKEGVPCVWMCNDVFQVPGEEYSQEKRVLFALAQKSIIGWVDKLFTYFFIARVIVLSHKAGRIVQRYYKKKPVVIRSGVDLENFEDLKPRGKAREELGIDKDSYMFLCCQFFLTHRRFEDAIVAFTRLKEKYPKENLKLYIIGTDTFDKAYAQTIKKLIAESPIQNNVVIKTNYFPYETLKTYFSASNVYIMPNEKYMWGLIAIEVMASGRVCIISNDAGASEVIEEGKNGFTFKVRNVNDLFERMEYSLIHKEMMKKIEKNARDFVFEQFSWSKYAESMEKVMREVC